VPTLRLKPKISSMLTSRGGAPLRTVDMCHDGRVPLAGQELLAIVVLAQWIGIGRIASQSALLGPLFQCVGIMLSDVLKWLVLTVWPLIAFTSSFTVLFREPYGSISDPTGSCDSDFDVDFEEWSSTLSTLMEVVLLSDVDLSCIRKSSIPELSWVLMATFLLVNVIMLVNLLIALMAKSFDNIFELQEKIFLYLFARQATMWQRYPAVPPPLNLLSVPYHIASLLVRLPRCCWACAASATERAVVKDGARARTAVTPASFTFPDKWAKKQSVDRVMDIANRFIAEHSSDVVREDRFKHELFTTLGRHFARVDLQMDAQNTHLQAQGNELRRRLDAMAATGAGAANGEPSTYYQVAGGAPQQALPAAVARARSWQVEQDSSHPQQALPAALARAHSWQVEQDSSWQVEEDKFRSEPECAADFL